MSHISKHVVYYDISRHLMKNHEMNSSVSEKHIPIDSHYAFLAVITCCNWQDTCF